MMRASVVSLAARVDSMRSAPSPLIVPAKTSSPGDLGIGLALAGDRGLIDVARAVEHFAVERDPLAGLHEERGAERHVLRRDLLSAEPSGRSSQAVGGVRSISAAIARRARPTLHDSKQQRDAKTGTRPRPLRTTRRSRPRRRRRPSSADSCRAAGGGSRPRPWAARARRRRRSRRRTARWRRRLRATRCCAIIAAPSAKPLAAVSTSRPRCCQNVGGGSTIGKLPSTGVAPRPARFTASTIARCGTPSGSRAHDHPAVEHIERQPLLAAHDRADLPLQHGHFFGAVEAGDAESLRGRLGHTDSLAMGRVRSRVRRHARHVLPPSRLRDRGRLLRQRAHVAVIVVMVVVMLDHARDAARH